MGTHISKVKSVDLDVWTVEQMSVRCIPISSSLDLLTTVYSLFRDGGTREQTSTGRHT